jgi:hypothetical protein
MNELEKAVLAARARRNWPTEPKSATPATNQDDQNEDEDQPFKFSYAAVLAAARD